MFLKIKNCLVYDSILDIIIETQVIFFGREDKRRTQHKKLRHFACKNMPPGLLQESLATFDRCSLSCVTKQM